MEELIQKIEELKKSKVKGLIDQRIKEFRKLGKGSKEKIFEELCFCILTANFNAERSIKIQKKIGRGFSDLSEEKLAEQLRRFGHRFPNARAKYIVEARKYEDNLNFEREWLVENIKGLGYKESSHFLRNIGFTSFAILDFHIIDILVKNKMIKRPKTLTKKKYLRIEEILKGFGRKINLNMSELDLYLWYLETGKIFK